MLVAKSMRAPNRLVLLAAFLALGGMLAATLAGLIHAAQHDHRICAVCHTTALYSNLPATAPCGTGPGDDSTSVHGSPAAAVRSLALAGSSRARAPPPSA
jgi:hypothetical protein